MASTVLHGKQVAQDIKAEIAQEVSTLQRQGQRVPHLAVIMVGEDVASGVYVKHKMGDCHEVGFDVTKQHFDASITEEALLAAISAINENPDIDGLIVQLPVPPHIRKNCIVDHIAPAKDVDGFHHLNFGRIGTDLPSHTPATAYGIMELLRRYAIDPKGMHAVVVGASYLVGLPTSILLSEVGHATVTIAHKYTRDLASITRQADLLVSAVGKPGLIRGDMVKEGVIGIDVGITRVRTAEGNYVLKGDMDYAEVAAKASYLTPVPNGVGPMTRVALLRNTLAAAKGIFKHQNGY